MEPNKKEIWFPAKKYGWGWGLPICWQGWIVLIVWMVLLSAGGAIPIFIPGYLGFEIYAAYVCVLGIALIIVGYLKGEKPRWRWGKD